MYRTHYLCSGALDPTGWKNGKEINDLSSGYKNITGASRFYEQCIADGSWDSYYDERMDYGTVPFKIGETKRGYEFAVTLEKATPQEASIQIAYVGQGRYKPTGKATVITRPEPPVVYLPNLPPVVGSPAASSVYDQLRELKKLLDEGVINQKDFEQKKKELLEKI
ncbi:MAG: SHOCT domain-containing protein [Candidatus Omnitrophica bacterium]|nr:SHOCT domain-containing protein [Candidatus Omnitrophota bacterium]